MGLLAFIGCAEWVLVLLNDSLFHHNIYVSVTVSIWNSLIEFWKLVWMFITYSLYNTITKFKNTVKPSR